MCNPWFVTVALSSFASTSVAITVETTIKSIDACSDLSLPYPLGFVKTAFFNNSIYVFGGQNGTTSEFPGTIDTKHILKYSFDSTTCNNSFQNVFSGKDNTNQNWTIINTASAAFNGYYGSIFVPDPNATQNDILYLFGPYVSLEGILWKYYFKNNTLIENTGIIAPNKGIAYCGVYDSNRHYIYLMGGTNCTMYHSACIAPTYKWFTVFDIETETFYSTNDELEMIGPGYSQMTSSMHINSGNRVAGECVFDEINDMIYYFGGWSNISVFHSNYLQYNINSKVWSLSTNEINTPRFFCSVTQNDRNVWFVGGYGFVNDRFASLNTIEVFNLDSKLFTFATGCDGNQILLPQALYGVDVLTVSVAGVSRLLTFGGRNDAGVYSSTVSISVHDDISSSFATTYESNYISNGIIDVSSDDILLADLFQCSDLQFNVGGIKDMMIVFLKYNNTLCTIGGTIDNSEQSNDVYCYYLNDVTCDSDVLTVDSSIWMYDVSKHLDYPLSAHDRQYVVVNDSIIYIFQPENININDNGVVIRYDIVQDEFSIFGHGQGNEFNILLATDPLFAPCVCHDEGPNANYIFALTDFSNITSNKNQFLAIFDTIRNVFLTELEMDNLGMQYIIPDTNLGLTPRVFGSCAYSSSLNSIFYFGGMDIKTRNEKYNIAIYNFGAQSWSETYNYILDNPRYLCNVVHSNNIFYLIGGGKRLVVNFHNDESDYNYNNNGNNKIEFEIDKYQNDILVYSPINNGSYISDTTIGTSSASIIGFGSVIVRDYTNNSIVTILGGMIENGTLVDKAYVSYYMNFEKEIADQLEQNEKEKFVATDLVTQIMSSTLSVILVASLVFITIISIVVAVIHGETRALDNACYFGYHTTDSVNWVSYIAFLLQLWDFFTDINFTYYLFAIFWDANAGTYLLLGSMAFVFTCLPMICNMYLFGTKLEVLLRELAPYNEKAPESYKSNFVFMTIWCVLSGNFYATLKLVNSRLFGWNAFNMGLTKIEIQRFFMFKVVITCILENFMQFILCIAVILISGDFVNITTLMSLIATTLSLIIMFFQVFQQFGTNIIELNWRLHIVFDKNEINSKKRRSLTKQKLNFSRLRSILGGCIDAEPNRIQIRNIKIIGGQVIIDGMTFVIRSKFDQIQETTNNVMVRPMKIVDLDKQASFFRQWKYEFPCFYTNDEYKSSLSRCAGIAAQLYFDKFISLINTNNANDMKKCVCQFFFGHNHDQIQTQMEKICQIKLFYFKRNFQEMEQQAQWDRYQSQNNINVDQVQIDLGKINSASNGNDDIDICYMSSSSTQSNNEELEINQENVTTAIQIKCVSVDSL